MSHEVTESDQEWTIVPCQVAVPEQSSQSSIPWDLRVSSAESLGQYARDKLLSRPSCEFVPPPTRLKSRIWVVVSGSLCAHCGHTDRFSVVQSHCFHLNPLTHIKCPAPLSIFQGFPSLREARVFWQQVYPEAEFDCLPVSCKPSEYPSSQ